jgi:integrase
MASFTKLASSSWRVQVRHKGRYVSESFQRREDARRWATDMEGRIDSGELATSARARGIATFEDLIDLHVADMSEVGKAPGRSKDATLLMLKRELGKLKMAQLDRELIVQFGRKRAAQGAGPVTLSMDIGLIRLVLSHAAAVHGLPVSIEQIDLGRIAFKRLGLVGKSNQGDRRPTDDELAKLIAHFDGNTRQLIPMGRIIKFTVATAMRQEEICRVTWRRKCIIAGRSSTPELFRRLIQIA